MDPSRFDRLAKALAVRRPRRVALPLLAVLGLSFADVEESWAAKSGRCKPRCGECARCRRGKCRKTKHGKKRCRRGRCQPLRFGTPCTTGICQNGSCFAAPPSLCPDGLTFCNGSCINTRTNNANCGGCGTVCPPAVFAGVAAAAGAPVAVESLGADERSRSSLLQAATRRAMIMIERRCTVVDKTPEESRTLTRR